MRRGLVVTVVAAFAVAGSVASASSTRTSFADGTWKGTAKLTLKRQGVTVAATATISMVVKRARVTGLITSRGLASGAYQGAPISATITTRVPMAGTAAKPAGRGTMKLAATVDGKVQGGTVPITYTLAGLRGTCSRMTGKLVLAAADAKPGDDTISAPFVATRTPGTGPAC